MARSLTWTCVSNIGTAAYPGQATVGEVRPVETRTGDSVWPPPSRTSAQRATYERRRGGRFRRPPPFALLPARPHRGVPPPRLMCKQHGAHGRRRRSSRAAIVATVSRPKSGTPSCFRTHKWSRQCRAMQRTIVELRSSAKRASCDAPPPAEPDGGHASTQACVVSCGWSGWPCGQPMASRAARLSSCLLDDCPGVTRTPCLL